MSTIPEAKEFEFFVGHLRGGPNIAVTFIPHCVGLRHSRGGRLDRGGAPGLRQAQIDALPESVRRGGDLRVRVIHFIHPITDVT